MWLGERGHLFGSTAAFALRLDGITKPSTIEDAIRRGSAVPGLRIHRLPDGCSFRTRNVDGLRLPVIEQTLLECAASLDPKAVGLAMDDALRRKMTSVGRLKRFLESNAGRGKRGIKTLRLLVEGRDVNDERVRSALETKMLRILRRIQGLEVLSDHAVAVDGERFVIDFFLPDPRIGIECHSHRWHDLARSHADLRRHRRISSAGIELLYFDWDDVTFAERETEGEIRAAIERRVAQLGS